MTAPASLRGQEDLASVLLSSIRARAVVVLHDLYRGDWAIEIPPTDQLAQLAGASSHDVVAAFHVVQHGCASIRQQARRWALGEGDVFIALQPGGHELRSPGSRIAATPLHLLLFEIPPVSPAPPADRGDTMVLCGVFVLERAALSPIAHLLRSNLHLPAARRPNGSTITDAIGGPSGPSSAARQFTTSRLLEVLLAEALTNTDGMPIAATADDFVFKSMALIDANPAEQWTVERLARTCAVSPSWLCERFRSALGITPMRFLADRRMTLAADLLLHSAGSVERIGHDVGFANQPAFTRAFKRRFGTPPSEWRAAQRETAARRAVPVDGV